MTFSANEKREFPNGLYKETVKFSDEFDDNIFTFSVRLLQYDYKKEGDQDF